MQSKFIDIFPKLLNYKLIIWDFDGVIKSSNEAKSSSFTDLFVDIDQKVKKKIEYHHYQNGGVSRYKKIPIYLSYNGISVTQENIDFYAQKFSNIVVRKVIESEWVPGIPKVFDLIENEGFSKNVILSATPQSELEFIIEKLKIGKYFIEIIGTSSNKSLNILRLLESNSIQPNECVFIGDSYSDYKASLTSNIDFIYRSNDFKSYNRKIECLYQIQDFIL